MNKEERINRLVASYQLPKSLVDGLWKLTVAELKAYEGVLLQKNPAAQLNNVKSIEEKTSPILGGGLDAVIDSDTYSVNTQSQTIETSALVTSNTLTPTSPEWTAWVLTHFTSDELIDDKPTCDGLRRVFEVLIGNILDARLSVVKAPTIQDPDVTVEFYIRYREHLSGIVKTISDGFNVNPNNTKFPWHLASVGTAATRAEARALRKGLRLQKILSQEEVDLGFDIDTATNSNNDKPIADNQRLAIKNMCKRMSIDIDKLIQSLELEPPLEMLRYSDGHTILLKLNQFQRGPAKGGEEIPEDILKDEEETLP
jgi:hypothetical protein